MWVYLAGRMAGIKDFNFPAFHAAADDLRRRGFGVINPAELDQTLDGFNPATDAPRSRHFYMKRDLPALMSCDGVVVLPGWEESIGAGLEAHTAVACAMPVLRYPDLVRIAPVFELTGVGELV